MMNCPFCNQEIPEDSNHCPCCGKSLEMVCSACHQVVNEFGYPQYKLCLKCSDPPCDDNNKKDDCCSGEHRQDEEDDDPYNDNRCGEEDDQGEDEPRVVCVGGDICGFTVC